MLMEGIFETVKNTVSLPAVAKEYGFTPTKAGFICCPFHSEKTPSLKLYDRRFHCFGCGAHGSVIDFVSALYGITPLDAAKKIAHDFGLQVDEPDRDAIERRHHVQEIRQHFDAWKETVLNQMDVVIRIANQADYSDLTDAEVVALRYREAFEYWGNILLHGTIDEQMDVFRDREGVERICRMVLKSTPTRLNTA